VSVQHPDPARITLAALPAEPADPEVVAHLADCAECREHVEALKRTVELARVGHADTAAPPSRVWDAIAAELDLESRTDARADDPTPAGPSPAGGPRRRPRWRAAAVPIAAALAGLAAGWGIAFALAPSPAPPPSPAVTVLAQLQPLGPADKGAAGTVDSVASDGSRELVISVHGVTDTAGGDYLEAWLIDPAGTRLVSLGALTPAAGSGAYHGDFTVPADLPMTTFTTVDISAERWDGNPDHSRISLLRGSMA
jgi:Anti-sigma-K factor rskA